MRMILAQQTGELLAARRIGGERIDQRGEMPLLTARASCGCRHRLISFADLLRKRLAVCLYFGCILPPPKPGDAFYELLVFA